MRLRVRFDAFDLREALTDAAVESMPTITRSSEAAEEMLERREDRYREALTAWTNSSGQESGQESGHDQIVVEFDLDADPPTARVLRRDEKRDEERNTPGQVTQRDWVLCKLCRDGLGVPSERAPCFGCGDMVFDVDDPEASP